MYRIIRRIPVESTTEQIATAQQVGKTASDLLLESHCLIWYINPDRDEQGKLMPLPLAASYRNKGSGDIRDKILVQDPVRGRGAFILKPEAAWESEDVAYEPMTFVKENLQGFGKAGVVEYHLAGDKIMDNRFFYLGDPKHLFDELEEKGYTFQE